MGNVLEFPTRNQKAEPVELPHVNLDNAVFDLDHRARTIANMRNAFLEAVQDALLKHGHDVQKPSMIITAFSMAIGDLAKIALQPMIIAGVENELRLMRENNAKK